MARLTVVFALLWLSWSAPASAQTAFEIVGARALGMGGAFVGVANDPSAIHWNPAGLAHGDRKGMTVEWDRLQFGDPKDLPTLGAAQSRHGLTYVATYPVGMSYGYFHSARVVELGSGGEVTTDGLRVHHIGFTFAQPIVEGLVVGATAKYLRGQASNGFGNGQINEDVLEEALGREVDSDGEFDVDLGIMADLKWVRVGFTAKNLLEPTFVGIAGFAIQLQRRYRLGLAVLPVDGLTLAFDIDLDTADPPVGLRRMMALGGDVRLGSSFALRSGVRWGRDGERRPIAALGASLRIRKGFWLDSFATYSRTEDRGWGVALRAGS